MGFVGLVTLILATKPILLAQPQLPKKPAHLTQNPAKSPLFQKVESYAAGKKWAGRSFVDNRKLWRFRTSQAVESYRLEMDLHPTRDDKFVMVVLRLKPFSKPEKLSKDQLFRMFIESREFGTAHFAYNLDDARFEIRQPIWGADFGEASLQDAIKRLSGFALATKATWDEALWKPTTAR